MATTPSTARLDAAVSLIVERLAPDQIILFGSGARGEMIGGERPRPLVIKEDDGDGSFSTRHERWRCPASGDRLDVQSAALEEGRTLYVREGVTPTPTGPSYTWNGEEMVRITRFEPDRAAELLAKARRKWVDANCSGRWSMRSRRSSRPTGGASSTHTSSTRSGSKPRRLASASTQPPRSSRS